jgi:transposase-like protein
MALKLLAKPLAASLKERIEAKQREVSNHRIAPPSAVNVEPDRSFVEKPRLVEPPAKEPAKPMAAKKMGKGKHGNRYTPEYRAQLVARALKARETGSEAISGIESSESLPRGTIFNWIKSAQKKNGTPVPAAKADKPRKSDLKTLSRELVEAMERVTVIKKKMRKLLDVD